MSLENQVMNSDPNIKLEEGIFPGKMEYKRKISGFESFIFSFDLKSSGHPLC